MPGVVPGPRPVPLLRVLRDRAGADVLPHRRLGLRQPGLRGPEVLPVHDARARPSCSSASLATAYLHQRATGALTFDLVEIAKTRAASPPPRRAGCSPSFAIAFAVKVPLFPLHTWLPDAHTQAPTAGSVILAGVMLKLGTYGFLRFGLYLFPEAAVWFAPAHGHAGRHRHHLRRHRAPPCRRTSNAWWPTRRWPTSASSCWAPSPSPPQSITGGVLQMVNHGISTGALFLLVGLIYERRHTREIAQLRGPAEGGPDLRRACSRVVMLSSIGVPGLNGFVGEFLVLHRLVPHPPVVDGGGRRRRDPRRALPAVGLPAGVPRRARRGQRRFAELKLREGLVMAPAAGPHLVPRRLPQADARPHRALRRAPGRARRGPLRLRRARDPGRPSRPSTATSRATEAHP